MIDYLEKLDIQDVVREPVQDRVVPADESVKRLA